jgi:uncharacterized protein (DUF433 family)
MEPQPDERTAVYPGMRLTVRRVVEAVATYPNRELFRNYLELKREHVRQSLAFAAANLEDSAAERATV